MNLDETIHHCEEVADKKEREKQKWERWLETDSDYRAVNEKVNCELCAKEHRQLAEWLKELKKYREILTELDAVIECYENCESCQGFREYSTSQFIKDIIRINKEVIK